MLEADRVVNGAGRVPNVEMLDLDAGKIAHDKGRIAIDDYLRSTSNETVWVAGDPIASPQLSPIAACRSIVGRNIVEGPRHRPGYASIPSCVYAVQALATVGLSEAAAMRWCTPSRHLLPTYQAWFRLTRRTAMRWGALLSSSDWAIVWPGVDEGACGRARPDLVRGGAEQLQLPGENAQPKYSAAWHGYRIRVHMRGSGS